MDASGLLRDLRLINEMGMLWQGAKSMSQFLQGILRWFVDHYHLEVESISVFTEADGDVEPQFQIGTSTTVSPLPDESAYDFRGLYISGEGREAIAYVRFGPVIIRIDPHRRREDPFSREELSGFLLMARAIFYFLTNEMSESSRLRRELSRVSQEVKKYQQQAMYCPLTGALTRSAGEKRLVEMMTRLTQYSGRLYIAFCDLDHFKQLNDRYGHQAGDEALRAFADIVRKVITERDLFSRFGGEEFLIGLSDLRGYEEIRRTVSETPIVVTQLDDTQTEVSLSVSIGVVTVSSVSSNRRLPGISTILRRADETMYRAKQEGRNRVIWGDVV